MTCAPNLNLYLNLLFLSLSLPAWRCGANINSRGRIWNPLSQPLRMWAAQNRRRVCRVSQDLWTYGCFAPFKPRNLNECVKQCVFWLFFFRSHRLRESSSVPDIAEDLKSIQSALGIAADRRIDFILIRDDLVAREVKSLFDCPDLIFIPDIGPISAKNWSAPFKISAFTL